MTDRLQRIISATHAKRTGTNNRGKDQYLARCPSHDDRTSSLSISTGDDGRALLFCQAGCSAIKIVSALGLRMSDLMPPKESTGNGSRTIVAAYDYPDASGVVLYQSVRFFPKDFRQRRPDGHGGWIWNMQGVQRVLYRLPEIIAADQAETVLIVEGEKDADNLRKLGFIATTTAGGAGKAKLTDLSPLAGRPVAIIPDADAPGLAHALDVAGRLTGKAASVKIVALPGEGKDASDWIAGGGAADELRKIIHAADEFDPARDGVKPATATAIIATSELPTIFLGVDEFRAIEETISALSSDPTIFQRGNTLVRVTRDLVPRDSISRAAGSPTISPVAAPNIRERITRLAKFTKFDKRSGEDGPAHPADWLVSAIHKRGDWPGIRPLLGVSDAPILRTDGTILQEPGYDEPSGVLFEPVSEFSNVAANATIDDADAALMRILEVICDFKFEAAEHRSAWVAGLLTPLARFAFEGPTPLFLIDANIRGAGKGLLAQVTGRIVLGREMPVSSYSHDSQEMRKRITACAIAGDRLLLLDNLNGVFGNDALDRALTTTRWKDRILGQSSEVELPLLACWYATGNNVQVAADTARRIIHIRLDVLDERPEDRANFRNPNLLSWVSQNRGALLSDALTILAAYIRAGRPAQGLTPYGSFEGWSDLVRSAVVWVGLPDPCLTRNSLAESADTTRDALSQLLTAWADYDSFGTGLTVSELLNRLYPQDRAYAPNDGPSESMRAAIENLVGCPPGRVPTPRQLGYKFREFRRRNMGGMMIDADSSESNKNGIRWRLIRPEQRRAAA